MKTLYLECSMGAAGDMLTAALLDLLPDRDPFLDKLASLHLPGVSVQAEKTSKCGITGTHMHVSVHGEEEHSHDVLSGSHAVVSEQMHHGHHHSTPKSITEFIQGLELPQKIKNDAVCVYHLIAEAEAEVHGRDIEQIHFHEVGTMDAVTDVLSVCMLMDEVRPDRVIVSPVHVGSGYVKCAHGILPVPAPATALLLQGIPVYSADISGELCTPTGAALLKYFADSFGPMPEMVISRVGYGMGTKDFPRANCVRAFLGTTGDTVTEQITVLECNLDDISGEELGYAEELLFRNGASDVFTVPIGMKKSRPAVLLKCICMPEDASALAELMMKHTTTAGIRRFDCQRYILNRCIVPVETKYGSIRMKIFSGMNTERAKPEYEDLAEAAKAYDVPLSEVRACAINAFLALKGENHEE